MAPSALATRRAVAPNVRSCQVSVNTADVGLMTYERVLHFGSVVLVLRFDEISVGEQDILRMSRLY